MNSREMLLSLIDRYILDDKAKKKQYNDNQVMIDLYNEVLENASRRFSRNKR